MIELKTTNEHTIITVFKVPELACSEQGRQLKTLFTDLIENNKTSSIVVNLKKVIFLNSSVIGTLINGQKMAKDAGIKFSLINVHPDLLNMLELASIRDLFTIYEDEKVLLH